MTTGYLIAEPLWVAAGWTTFHFLWIGAAIGLIALFRAASTWNGSTGGAVRIRPVLTADHGGGARCAIVHPGVRSVTRGKSIEPVPARDSHRPARADMRPARRLPADIGVGREPAAGDRTSSHVAPGSPLVSWKSDRDSRRHVAPLALARRIATDLRATGQRADRGRTVPEAEPADRVRRDRAALSELWRERST